MKRIAIVGAGLLACSMLFGCSDQYTLNQSIFTPTEVAVYNAYWSQRSETPSYRRFLDAVGAHREYKAPKGDTFFCDSLSSLHAADWALDARQSSTKNLSMVFQEIYGITPEMACGVGKVTPEPIRTVRVSNEPQALSPAMYDELIKVASSCGRSKAFLLNLTESKEYLTKDDYDSAIKAVMSCKKYELEKSLQQ